MRRIYEEMDFSKEACVILNERKNRTFVDIVKGEIYTNTMLKDIIFRFNAERAFHDFDLVHCNKVDGLRYRGVMVFDSAVYSFECENCMDLMMLRDNKTPEQLLKCIKSCNINETCSGATKSRLILFLCRHF